MIDARGPLSEARRSARIDRSRGFSVQYQLPLLICALLVLTVVPLASWSYSSARSSLLVSAGVELDAAVHELADVLSRSAGALLDDIRAAAAEPAVIDALRDPSEAAFDAARVPLENLFKSSSQARVAELWSNDREPVLVVEQPNRDGEAPPAELRDASVAPERPGLQPLRSIGETAFFEIVADVREPSKGDLVGRLVLRQRLRSGREGLSLLRNLIARDAVMMLGNRAGGAWTDFERSVSGPAIDPLDRTHLTHRGRDGVEKLGTGIELSGTPWVMWAEVDSRGILAPARSLLWRTGLVSLALLLVATGGAWWISRRVSAPLNRVTEAAEAIAAGRRDRRVAATGPEEVRRLAGAFNLMVAKVERRTAELERVRDEYEDLYERSPDMFVSVQMESGRIVQCNETTARRLGYAKDQLIGRQLVELCDPDCGEKAMEVLDVLAATGVVENAPLTLHDQNRRRIPVLLNASALRDQDGRVLLTRSSLRDVSDVVAAEGRRTAVVRGAMDAIVTINGEGRVVEFNPAAEALFGYTAAEANGTSLAELIIPSRHRRAHEVGLARYLVTGEGPILGKRLELHARRKDGTEFPVEIAVVKLAGTEELLFTGFIRDLTSLRTVQDDLERTIADLRRSNEDLEQFAFVASHDLQEPLRMVAVFMEMLDQEYRGRLDETADQYIAFAAEGAERMKRLINGLLAYSRIRTRGGSLQVCACGDVLADALRNLSMHIVESHATIQYDDMPMVWADAAQLQQVFQNLVSNALKFRGDDPLEISIHVRRAGDDWEFVVEDNGIGFDPDKEDRIFQMFQRLHDRRTRDGNGIGLALAKRIVERHRGRLWATSTPGVGSRFYFTLPMSPIADEPGIEADAAVTGEARAMGAGPIGVP